jgi:hypothetical protein
MLKRIGFVLALIAAMATTTAAFAQAPTDVPLPATRVRINFVPGTSAYTLTTNLTQGVSQGYVLGLASQQVLYVTQSGNASVQVLDPYDNVLAGTTTQPGPWGVGIPQTGDYTVVLFGQGLVAITFHVPPLGSSSQPPVPLPLYRQRIRFAPGSTGDYFRADLVQGLPAAFVLGISAQQQLNVAVQGNMTVAVLDPQDNALRPMVPLPAQWQFGIPQTGDYTLVLLGAGTGWISINIPPFAGVPAPPPPAAQRISFAPGADSITVTPNLMPGTGQAFILGIARGQMLHVFASEGTTFEVYDPQGNRIAYSTWWGGSAFDITQDGDYTVTFHGQGQANIRFYIPPLPNPYQNMK